MSRDLWLRRACWAGSVVFVLLAGTLVHAQDDARQIILRLRAGNPFADDRNVIVYAAAGEDGTEARSAYWIGVIGDPVDAPLRAQLKLKDQGLWVREVVPDAPAAKAGIKVNDILLAVGDKELSDVGGLADAVEKSEGKEITLHLLRAGEKQAVKVTPAKRDKASRTEDLPGDVRRWFELHRAGPDGWRAEMLRPGVLGLRVHTSQKLPKDMTVTITKEGESPAKIVVKQGDKTWETTEEKLKELPDEVRKHVAPMVRPGTGFFTEKVLPPAPVELPPLGPRASERRLEKQVDELKKQIDKLQKAVEELSPKGKEKQ
jgi:membrane-associated protease RseP (regulator of RpoE activity)